MAVKRSYIKYIITFWAFVLLCLAVPILFFYLLANGTFGEIPDFKEIENPKNAIASEIFSSDSVILGKYYINNRSPVNYNQLPENLLNALIATEDVRFYNHPGIDFRGLAAIPFYLAIGKRRGSSTITQQLAKNLFHAEEKRTGQNIFLLKPKEWIVAVMLEKRYTKREIITMYLNTVDFGNGAFGIKSAARKYFNKHPAQLTPDESAVLVGLLKGTTLYNPKRNPENALNRRNVVLAQMLKYEFISPEEFEKYSQKEIELEYVATGTNVGYATYFREMLRQQLKKWCRENPKPNGEPYDLYRDGLKIYTTINFRLQKYAEEAVKQHLSWLQKQFDAEGKHEALLPNSDVIKRAMQNSPRYYALRKAGLAELDIMKSFKKPVRMDVFTWNGIKDTTLSPLDSIKHYMKYLHTGFLSIDPANGHIKAWVGGINHRFYKYDHVRQSKRQVGSTFKPFVYAFAIDNGYQPCQELLNTRICISPGPNQPEWCPNNSPDTHVDQYLTLKQSMAQSVNRTTAALVSQVGVKNIIQFAKNLGIKSELPPVPSIALGTGEISLYEMVGAYTTFANQGIRNEPVYLLKIEDKYGNELVRFQEKQHEVLNETSAYTMLKMLQGSVDGVYCRNHDTLETGTGKRLRAMYKLEGDMGGKTGTTQNGADGWFIGIAPGLVSGAWVGADDKNIFFKNPAFGQGAAMALPIWAKYMKKVYSDKSLPYYQRRTFSSPADDITTETDCKKYFKEELSW